MQNRESTSHLHPDARIFLWLVIAVYTFFLPDARLAYDAIVNSFGQSVAGKVPIVVVSFLGFIYTLVVYLKHKNLKNLLYLVPCAVIAYLIMRLVDNPNKHIHIPEYTLMVWLLFKVLSKDYESKDIFILIFLCTTALGVVDELEQGIHPARFYGFSDMLVNSASGLIGIFTVMGLMDTNPADWRWISRLKEMRGLLGLCLAGTGGAVVTCAYLFRVQAAGVFPGVYPDWLLTWNIFYLIASPLAIVIEGKKIHRRNREREKASKDPYPAELSIAHLWTVPLLIMIAYMNALVVYLAVSGVPFR